MSIKRERKQRNRSKTMWVHMAIAKTTIENKTGKS